MTPATTTTTNSNNNNTGPRLRPDRKEMVLLRWRDFGMEMSELDIMDALAKVASLN